MLFFVSALYTGNICLLFAYDHVGERIAAVVAEDSGDEVPTWGGNVTGVSKAVTKAALPWRC